jgi:hypothetical protein
MGASAWMLLVTAFATSAFGGNERGLDPHRVVDKAEIVAMRPPDADHEYALELDSLVPIEHSSLLVSTHRGPGRGDELTIWAKVAGGYRRLETFVVDEPTLGSYAPVAPFRYGGQLFLLVSFVASGTAHAHDDTVLVVEEYAGGLPTLARVQIESPVDRFRVRLAPDESVQDGVGRVLADERLEWTFGIWKSGDPHCCPTAGQMHGTFAVCRDQRHDDSTDRWISTWRMFADEGKREPIGGSTTRTTGRVLDSCLAGGVRAQGVLPDSSGRLPHDSP